MMRLPFWGSRTDGGGDGAAGSIILKPKRVYSLGELKDYKRADTSVQT
jgi:hypothetical protein